MDVKYKVLSGCEVFLLNIKNNDLPLDFGIIPSSQIVDISKYSLEHDRKKRLLARHFLYKHLRDKYRINDFELSFNSYKKPYLKNNSHIDFSISYSKDYVLLGISDKYRIGVDIEYIDESINHSELINLIMNCKEVDYYNELICNNEKKALFFDVFNVKESIIKCIGMGLYFDVRDINILALESLKSKGFFLTKNLFDCISSKYKTSLVTTVRIYE